MEDHPTSAWDEAPPVPPTGLEKEDDSRTAERVGALTADASSSSLVAVSTTVENSVDYGDVPIEPDGKFNVMSIKFLLFIDLIPVTFSCGSSGLPNITKVPRRKINSA